MIFWYPTTYITSSKKMVPDKFQAISGPWYHVFIQEVVKGSPPPQEKHKTSQMQPNQKQFLDHYASNRSNIS